jgi:regulatory protein
MLETNGQLERALEFAYRYLDRRDRTAAEMRSHLMRKGLTAGEVDRAIDALGEQGYLDDTRFARLFVDDRRELADWGSERIRRALEARGIDRELIDAALEPEAQTSELDRAVALLQRRFPTPPRDRREHERALGFLLRKGYETELALDALRAHARNGDLT